MLESQRRKLQMQKIAKGGVQKSGVKKPTPAKPAGPARASIGNVRGPGGRGRPASAQAKDAKNWQKLNQSASAKAGKAAEPKPRTPAPGTGNVLKSAQQFSADKAAKDRAARRQAATTKATRNATRGAVAGAVATSLMNTPAEIAKAKALLKDAGGTVRRAANEFLSGNPAQSVLGKEKNYKQSKTPVGPSAKATQQKAALDAQERKAREKLAARKKAAGSSAATPNTAKSFDDAFKDARRAKVSTFTWRGKKYTTKLK